MTVMPCGNCDRYVSDNVFGTACECGWKVGDGIQVNIEWEQRDKMIYILQGSTGAYEDVYTWVVRAYNNKEQAESDHRKASEEAAVYHDEEKLLKEAFCHEEHTDDEEEEFDNFLARKRQEMLTVDPKAMFDWYYNTIYWITETELV